LTDGGVCACKPLSYCLLISMYLHIWMQGDFTLSFPSVLSGLWEQWRVKV